MVDGERLRERMEELGFSQSALGREVGISQQTIHKLITGASRGSTKIARIARALRTTPAYLEGETDDPSVEIPTDHLSADERELVHDLRELSDADRALVAGLVERLRDGPELPDDVPDLMEPRVYENHKSASPTVHDPRRDYRGG